VETRYNEARAEHAVNFFAKHLRHTKGRWRGAPFILEPWQADDIIRPVFGWERFSPELQRWIRLYRKVYLELVKKVGKSELGAGIADYGLYADGEGGPEVFGVASDKKQAGLVFGVAADMVEANPVLKRRSQVNRSRIAHHGVIWDRKGNGVFKVLPGDAGTVDGINPSMVILDELHRQPGRELYDLLDQSFAARDEPLYIILTTAGHDEPGNVAWELHNYALDVVKGVIEDPYLFVYMRFCSVEETAGDGWKDEKLWRRVNPAITSFNPGYIDEMRRVAAEAARSPAKVVSFKRLFLNVWLPRAAASADKLVDLDAWDQAAGIRRDLEDFRGRPCFAGLDLAGSVDINALVGLFPNEPGTCPEPGCQQATERCYHLIARFWVPEEAFGENAREWARPLKEQLAMWAADGSLTVLPGRVIDDRAIQAEIEEWAGVLGTLVIAKDPWQSKQLGVLLEEAGLDVFDQGQTFAKLADPTDHFIRLAVGGRLHHMGHPVLRWMVSNAIAAQDTAGNKKPDRKRSQGKIDGVAATVNAVAAILRPDDEGQVWALAVGHPA
jgi:phage terminase large subunit-like protein